MHHHFWAWRGDSLGRATAVHSLSLSRSYGSMLAVVDAGIGNVTAALRDSGLWENTILLVTADNGGDNVRQKGDDGVQCEGHGKCTVLYFD